MSAPSTGSAETVLPPQRLAVAEPTPLPDHSRPLTKPRMLYVDNLHSVLISMVVLLHLAITYGATGDWWYNEKVPESTLSGVALTLYTTIAQAFTLAFFFMISSYFCPPAYDKKGPGAFAKDKLKRLGSPFLFYFIVLTPFLPLLISGRWDWWESWVSAIISIACFTISRALAARRRPDPIAERAHTMFRR